MKGVVAMFDGGNIYDFVEARDWSFRRFPEMAFTPEQVIAAAAPTLELDGPYDESGIYFLIRGGRICYIGKAKELRGRIYQHRKQRRPFDAVAAIAGIHWEFIGELEAAYVNAWSPPWNAAAVYGGAQCKLVRPKLEAMDLALICTLPEHELSAREVDSILEKMNSMDL